MSNETQDLPPKNTSGDGQNADSCCDESEDTTLNDIEQIDVDESNMVQLDQWASNFLNTLRKGDASFGSLLNLNTSSLYGDADADRGTHGTAVHGHGDGDEDDHDHDHDHDEDGETKKYEQNTEDEETTGETEQPPAADKPQEKGLFNKFMAALSDGAGQLASGAAQLTDQAGQFLKEKLGIPKDAKIFYNSETNQYGYTHTSTDQDGNTVDTKVTFSGRENSRNEFTTVTNPDGQRLQENSSFKSTDGSEWGSKKRWRADGTKEAETQYYLNSEEKGVHMTSNTVWYDKQGKVESVSTALANQETGIVETDIHTITQADLDAAAKQLGPKGHELLKQAGAGNEIFGYLGLKTLGEGNVDAGIQALTQFGPNAEAGIKRLNQFGSGNMVEGVNRLYTMGEGDMDRGLKALTTLGGGNLVVGMDRLEHLGSRTGNAALGIENLRTLAKGHDFETGIKNLWSIAYANGLKNYGEAIAWLDEMGNGNPEDTIKALTLLGNGDAGVVNEMAHRLGHRHDRSHHHDGKESKEEYWETTKRGYDLLIKAMSDGRGLLNGVENLSQLDKQKSVDRAIAYLERNPQGCTGSCKALCKLGTDREGRESFAAGVEAHNRFDGKKEGEEHDHDLAQENFQRFITRMKDGVQVQDWEWGAEQALNLTRDKDGNVNGLDAAHNIASLDDHNQDFSVGMQILSRATDTGLPGEGVQGILSIGDDQTLDSAKLNLRLASSDQTVGDGVERVRHFADNGDSFEGGRNNLTKIDPNGTMEQRIRDVIAFDNTDDGVSNFEGGTANIHKVNPNGTISANIDDVARFGNRHDDGTATVFRDGTANLVLVGPDRQMDQRIASVIAASDTVNGEQTFAGGTANVQRVDLNGKISDNIALIINFDDKAGGLNFDGGIANLRLVQPDQPISHNIDSVKNFGDNLTFAGGTDNLRRITPGGEISQSIASVHNFSDRDASGQTSFDGGTENLHRIAADQPLSANIDRVINFSNVGANGERTFDGGTANLVRISPDSQISANIDRVHAFSDNGTGGWDGGAANIQRIAPDAQISANIDRVHAFSDYGSGGWDGGAANIQRISPDSTISANIDRVIAFSDNGKGGWDGGAANLQRISPDSPTSANIDRVIGFSDNGAGGRTWDGGAANIQLINPNAPTSANIDRVIAFSDNGAGGRTWDGGAANLRAVNPNAETSANITSVINFGDKNAQGQRTWDSGVDNLRAINPNAQMSSNIQTVINFGDTTGGTKTFDSGRQNIQSVNPNGTIRENINAVASFSDRPNATFADGAANLSRMTNSDGQMSGAIRNVQSLSNDGTFAGGTQVMRQAGNGSVERTITAMQTLAPNGNMSQAVDAVKAAGQGNAERGLEALRQFGNNDVLAGAQRLQQAVPNITPQQIEALVTAGNGKLEVGLSRVQQAGGFDKLAADNKGDILAGAHQLRQQAEAAEAQQAAAAAAAKNSVAVSTSDTTPTQYRAQTPTGNQYENPTVNRTTEPPRIYTASYLPRETSDHDLLGHGQDDRRPVAAPNTVAARVNADQPFVVNQFRLTGANVTLARTSVDQGREGRDGSGLLSPLQVAKGNPVSTYLTAPRGADVTERQLTTQQAQAFLAQMSRLTESAAFKNAMAMKETIQPFAHLLATATRMDALRAGTVHVQIAQAAFARMQMQNEARCIANAAATQQLLIHAHRAGVAAHISEVEKTHRQFVTAAELAAQQRGIKGQEGQTAGNNAHVVRSNRFGATIAFNPVGHGSPFEVRFGRYPLMGAIDIATGRSQQLTFTTRLPAGRKLALIGPEIALAALLVSAGVARARGADKAAAEKALLLQQQQAQAAELAAAENLRTQDDDDARSKVHKYDPRIRPTWLVRPGEDLCKLADHLFHDAKLGWLIADINSANIKELFDGRKRVIELYVRQKIELPVWQDIVEFHKLKVEFELSDLITIVTDTQIEQELMQNTLAPVMGVASAQAPTPATAPGTVPGTSPVPQPVAQPAAQPGAPALQPIAARVGDIQSTLAALANAGAALAGLKGGKTPNPNAVATVTDHAGASAQGKAHGAQVVELPALNAARIAADVTLTDRQDPTAVATANEEVPAPALKPKYA